MTNDELKNIAKNAHIPEWATHVAVKKDGTKIGPALKHTDEFLDMPMPKRGEWASTFKKSYWSFFSKQELQCN